MNLPEKFLEKIPHVFSASQTEAVLHSFSVPHTISFRANPLLSQTPVVFERLRADGFEFLPQTWYPDAASTLLTSATDLSHHPLHTQGHMYVQNLSSMIPALILSPTGQDYVLDMAAAPGSKTSQLAALMGNEGLIIASDSSPDRLFKLKANLARLSVLNTHTMKAQGEFLWRKYPDYFDRVLLDAPCSLEGTFHQGDPRTFSTWSPKKVGFLANKQKHLLRSAVACTKPGGIIVYSTCTISPEENEAVVDWVLNREPGKVRLEPVTLPGVPLIPGLTQWKNKQFHPDLQVTARVVPSPQFEAFYIAKLVRV